MIDTKQYKEAVSAPGKFENEPIWTPYYWDQVLNGDGEEHGEDGENVSVFEVNAEESEAFKLQIGTYVIVRESSDGFVIGWNLADRSEVEDWIRDWLKGLGYDA